MAKRLFEEERIRAIAAKIKKYDSSWFDGLTTAEMPKGIERVYEIGFADGRQSGYNDGRNASNAASNKSNYERGYSDGYDKGYVTGFGAGENLTKLPELTCPGTPEDLVAGTQLIDAHRNVVEGALDPVPMLGILVAASPYTVDTASGKEIWFAATYSGSRSYIEDGTSVIVTSVARNFGNAPAAVVPVGYTFTSEAGLKVEGAAPMRTATDLEIEELDNENLGLRVPSGYYANDAHKQINIKPYYNEGYSLGYRAGYTQGFDEGVASVDTYEDGNEVRY